MVGNYIIDLKEIVACVGGSIDSAQEWDFSRVLRNAALDLRVPYALELVI